MGGEIFPKMEFNLTSLYNKARESNFSQNILHKLLFNFLLSGAIVGKCLIQTTVKIEMPGLHHKYKVISKSNRSYVFFKGAFLKIRKKTPAMGTFIKHQAVGL